MVKFNLMKSASTSRLSRGFSAAGTPTDAPSAPVPSRHTSHGRQAASSSTGAASSATSPVRTLAKIRSFRNSSASPGGRKQKQHALSSLSAHPADHIHKLLLRGKNGPIYTLEFTSNSLVLNGERILLRDVILWSTTSEYLRAFSPILLFSLPAIQ